MSNFQFRPKCYGFFNSRHRFIPWSVSTFLKKTYKINMRFESYTSDTLNQKKKVNCTPKTKTHDLQDHINTGLFLCLWVTTKLVTETFLYFSELKSDTSILFLMHSTITTGNNAASCIEKKNPIVLKILPRVFVNILLSKFNGS